MPIMRSLLSFAMATFAGLVLVSCNSGTGGHSHPDSPTAVLDSLELNNGSKWQMSPEMGTMFNESVSYFKDSNYPTLDQEALKTAGTGLHQRMMKIIQSCNMTGQAHNQLHIFITGYLPAIKKLSDNGQMEDAKVVDHYLTTYTEFFE
jgi:hypothetical protein